MRVPVVSDTHGLLRPAVAEALAGAPLILHAGDVGRDATLEALEAIAPTRAIRGNVDRAGRVAALPETDVVELAGRRLYLIHDRQAIAIDPADPPDGRAVDVVISGHSHRPHEERRDGVLWLNPGSVGPRRFRLPISMAWVTLDETGGPPAVEFATFDP